jgi:hypothetical protein
MTNIQVRGSVRAAIQAGGWKRPVQGFTLRYLPLMLAIAAAGCDRSKAGGQESAKPNAEDPTVRSAIQSPEARVVPATEKAVSAKRTPAAAGLPPRPSPVAAPLTMKASATVARAGPPAKAVVVNSPAARLPAADVPAAAATAGTEPLLVTDAERKGAPGASELGGGELDGLVLAPGVYAWSTNVSIPAEVTLAGDAEDVWVFRIARDLRVADQASVVLTGGARAGNVLWLVAGRVTLGAGAVLEGTIESPVPVSQGPGAVVTGGITAGRDLAPSSAEVAKLP